jgi:hypothetical protein
LLAPSAARLMGYLPNDAEVADYLKHKSGKAMD